MFFDRHTPTGAPGDFQKTSAPRFYFIMRNKLRMLRKQIDEIDESIVALLVKRMKVVKAVGRLKKKQSIPALDLVRWQKVIKSKKGYVKKIWEIIHEESLKIEKNI